VAALALLLKGSTPLISDFASAFDEVVAFALALLCVDSTVDAADGATDKLC
jgi:hypothetical protein